MAKLPHRGSGIPTPRGVKSNRVKSVKKKNGAAEVRADNLSIKNTAGDTASSEKQQIFDQRPQSTSATRPAMPPFRWNLDRISETGIEGWIESTDDPSRPCVVAVRESGRVLARGVASRFRQDLLNAGVGDGCRAFDILMPPSLFDGAAHFLEVIEERSGMALNSEPIPWPAGSPVFDGIVPASAHRDAPAAIADADVRGRKASDAGARTRILFDVSDLIYYLAENPNLTGIQRVQSSIVLAMIDGNVISPDSAIFLSFNSATRSWVAIPTGFFISLLRDLFLPTSRRLIGLPTHEARHGVLPGAQPFDGRGVLDDGNPSVLCVMGAAWVHQDYLHRVLTWKRRFGTRFVMIVHDLIPIYARETCHQETAQRFEDFMRQILPHVDHILAVSENTAKDVRRYVATLRLPDPAITVTKNGSSFAEFLPPTALNDRAPARDLPRRFVLFVATIEGRKNHQLIFDVWKRMVDAGDDPPHLICVGKLGWKANTFVSAVVETNYLDGRIQLLREVSDTDLQMLYDRCLFTLCPSFYEGWGLPVGESLAMGKICVCSDRASIPEVAGKCGVYIDIGNIAQSLKTIRDLIQDDAARRALEANIRRSYVPTTWRSVAQRVVAACKESANVKWQEPYPFAVLPYSTEVSFALQEDENNGTGESLLTRIVDERRGHFTGNALDRRSFSLGQAIRAGGTWAHPEPWGVWLCHAGGEVEFMLPPDSSAFDFLFLRLRLCSVLETHAIRVVSNGERLWEGKLGPHPMDLMLRIRKRTSANRHWRMRLGLEIDLSRELVDKIAGVDSRVPTIGFERLMIVPEDDLKTRLDVLTNSPAFWNSSGHPRI